MLKVLRRVIKETNNISEIKKIIKKKIRQWKHLISISIRISKQKKWNFGTFLL